ncbi:MAG: ParB N-terminal domain-containing protein [Bacteroidota bacterium]
MKEEKIVANSEALSLDLITIDSDLKNFITPLSEEEFHQLMNNIRVNGCKDPLTVWEKGEQLILIDGHNRYQICKELGISFEIDITTFKNKEEAKDWMIDHQLGRRNLTTDQLSYYRGLKYERMKRRRGGYQQVISKSQNEPSTKDKLADVFKVSKSTILRDAAFARGIEIIGQSNPKLKSDILQSKIKVKKKDVQILSETKRPNGLVFKNEKDLYHKAKSIRRNIEKNEHHRIDVEVEEIKFSDPIFITREQRIARLKGDIISSINKCIRNSEGDMLDKAIESINQLRILFK